MATKSSVNMSNIIAKGESECSFDAQTCIKDAQQLFELLSKGTADSDSDLQVEHKKVTFGMLEQGLNGDLPEVNDFLQEHKTLREVLSQVAKNKASSDQDFFTSKDLSEWIGSLALAGSSTSTKDDGRTRLKGKLSSRFVYGAVERPAEKWVHEQLLVPRKQRTAQALISRVEEDENQVVKAAMAANERLKGSALNRCPTGRLPGLGTCKSEEILRKVAVETDSKRSKEEIEQVFNDWLKSKKASSSSGDEDGKTNAKLSEEEKAQRKLEAEKRFKEWKRKKDKELKQRKQQELPKNEEVQQPSSPQKSSIVSKDHNNTQKQHIGGVKICEKEKKRFAPYFVPLRTNGKTALDEGRGTYVKRFLTWYSKNEDKLNRAFEVNEGGGDRILTEDQFLRRLAISGYKNTLHEGPLLYARFFGNNEGETKHEQEVERNNQGITTTTVLEFFGQLTNLVSKVQQRKAAINTQRRKRRTPSSAVRIVESLSECFDVIERCASTEKLNSHRALSHAFVNLLELQLNLPASLLDKDIKAASMEYWKQFAKRKTSDKEEPTTATSETSVNQTTKKSLAGFVDWLKEAKTTSTSTSTANALGKSEHPTEEAQPALVIEVDDFRNSLRGFYNAIEGPKSAKVLSEFIEELRTEITERLRKPLTHIDGTVWLDLMRHHGFQEDGNLETDGVVPLDVFVNFWSEKYQIYQQQSLNTTSPTHRARCLSASRRGSRSRKAVSSPPKIRIVKSQKQKDFEKERGKELERVYDPGHILTQKRPASSAEQAAEKRKHRLHLQHLEIKAINMNLRRAMSTLTSVTTEQIVQVLNLPSPPPKSISRSIGAVCILIGVKPTWKHARKLFKNWPGFISMLSEASGRPPVLTDEQINMLQVAIDQAEQDSSEKLRLIYFLELWVSSLFQLMKKKGLVPQQDEQTEPSTPNLENKIE